MHCDALTCEGAASVTAHSLRAGGALLQCFAAFVRGEDRFADTLLLCDKFDALCLSEGLHPVRSFSDIEQGQTNALLTVEGGGAIEGDIAKLETLYRRGVRMMTLVWNEPNRLGYPAFPDYQGLSAGNLAERETARGLTDVGREAVERMAELKMLADVSHGSDKLFEDVAEICKRKGVPFVASHSGANAVQSCARNLTDFQIRTLADCGGAVGLVFCADFLSRDLSREGQREALLAHARRILSVGGEDVLCLGSDFDGMPPNPYITGPADVPKLLEDFERAFSARVAEKIASGNFLRVFKEISQ